MSIHTKVRHTL